MSNQPGFQPVNTEQPQTATSPAPAPVDPKAQTNQLVSDIQDTLKILAGSLEKLAKTEGYEMISGAIGSLNLVAGNITTVHANASRKA